MGHPVDSHLAYFGSNMAENGQNWHFFRKVSNFYFCDLVQTDPSSMRKIFPEAVRVNLSTFSLAVFQFFRKKFDLLSKNGRFWPKMAVFGTCFFASFHQNLDLWLQRGKKHEIIHI